MLNKDLNVLTDETLVKMAKEGSSTAEEYLISKYKGLAKQKAKTYFIAGADNEDVIQEGMIGIFKAIRDFDEEKETSFRTFADLCVNRQIISAIKKANRLKHQILNESLSLNQGNREDEKNRTIFECIPSGKDDNPEELMLMKEVVDFLKVNDDDIFSKMENMVWNEMLKGKNYKEIALTLHKTPKAIDNTMQRIKKKISWYLEG